MNDDSIWIAGDKESQYWVVFESTVMETIALHRQYHLLRDLEACGVLLGERRGPHIKVTHITTPFPTDIRTPTHYTRSSAGHQEIIDRLHSMSHGVIQYLGEWHTHPQQIAQPSMEDYSEWGLAIANMNNANDKTLFFIAGLDVDYLGIYLNSRLSKAKPVLDPSI